MGNAEWFEKQSSLRLLKFIHTLQDAGETPMLGEGAPFAVFMWREDVELIPMET